MTTAALAYDPGRADSAVRAVGLSKRYGRVWALSDCSFDVPAGRVVALVGANGAGKTTLMKLLCGATRPTSGSIAARGRVAYVGQDKPLYPDFSVAETMEFGRRMNTAWDRSRAEGWLTGFGVPFDRRCARLSGGERAQVALALAIGSCPDVLVLDEPLANLDPLVRKDIVARLLDVVAQVGVTVLFSTHVVAELHGVADRLLVLAAGRLILQGDVDDLLDAHCYVTGPAGVAVPAPRDGEVVHQVTTARQTVALVRRPPLSRAGTATLPRYAYRPAALDELIVDYLSAHAYRPEGSGGV